MLGKNILYTYCFKNLGILKSLAYIGQLLMSDDNLYMAAVKYVLFDDIVELWWKLRKLDIWPSKHIQ